jgi:transcriptional regulator with XRE-family HTH domain
MKDTPAIGPAIRAARKLRGLSQDDFSVISSRTYMSSLERGTKSPTLNKLFDLAGTLDLHPASLVVLATGGKRPLTALLRDIERIKLEVSELKAHLMG